MILRIATILAAISIFSASARASDEADLRASESLVKAFLGLCLQPMPNLDKIEAGALSLNWKELKGVDAKLMAPAAPDAWSRSWLVMDAAEVPFMIGISRGAEKGMKIVACALTNPYAPARAIQLTLTRMLSLGAPISTTKEAGEQVTVWTTRKDGQEFLIRFLDATPMNDPGVTIGALLIEPAR